jgi:hypothetical protein
MTRANAAIFGFWLTLMGFIAYISWLNGKQPQAPAEVIREVVRAESVFVTDTVRLRQVLTRWDTVRARDTIVVDNVVYVPVRVVDSIVEACRPLITSCATLVAAVRDSARAVGDRPWQSAGLTWPAGVYYERDFRKFRGGASVGADAEGRVRAELRAGIRWD